MQRTRLAWLACVAFWCACSDKPGNAKGTMDGGWPEDSGMQHRDAASEPDAGSKTDAASEPDAGLSEPGTCTPRGGPAWASLVGNAESLADAIDGSYAFLGVISGQVYIKDIIANNGKTEVLRVPATGGDADAVLTIASENAPLVLGDTYLYYASSADQTGAYPVRYRVPLASPQSTPEEIAELSPSLPLLAQGDTLYGYDETNGVFWRQDFQAGLPETLGTRTGEEPTRFVLADGYLYYPNAAFGGESLRRLSLSTGTVEQLSGGVNRTAAPLLIADGTAFWGGAGPLFATPIAPPGETRTLGKTSGIDPFSNLAREPAQLSLHGERLYWVDAEDSVAWAALDALSCGSILSTSLQDSFNHRYWLDGGWLYVLYEPDFEPTQLWRYPLP